MTFKYKVDREKIVLASISPRRKMLLEQVQIPFIQISPAAEERVPQGGDFSDIVVRNAIKKAESVGAIYPDNLILAADTLVELVGKPLGKPIDSSEAKEMLRKLSGCIHNVHSGIAVCNSKENIILSRHVETRVTFRNLTEEEIDDYIATGEPLDKAGSYGIQGRGALFIERIEGCFFNVMGLSLSTLWEMLKEIGYN